MGKQKSLIAATKRLGWALSSRISQLRLTDNLGRSSVNKRYISFQTTELVKSSEVEGCLTKELKEKNFWLQPQEEAGLWTVFRGQNRVGEINIKNTTHNENKGSRFVSLEILQDTAH